MAGKNHQLKYRYADWEVIEARQDKKWAKMASDVTVTKMDGSVEIIPNTLNHLSTEKKKKDYYKKRQQMFDGNNGV